MTINNTSGHDRRRFKKADVFGGVGPTFKCRNCGRTTRDTGNHESELQMCRKCLEDTYMENAHFDGEHDVNKNPNCKYCNE